MKAWFWCPCCERAFRAEVPRQARSPLTELLTSLGICEPSPVDCPYDDCGATARCVMTWASLERWAAMSHAAWLPPVPVEGQRYSAPLAALEEQTA